jgi:hypothetical protein
VTWFGVAQTLTPDVRKVVGSCFDATEDEARFFFAEHGSPDVALWWIDGPPMPFEVAAGIIGCAVALPPRPVSTGQLETVVLTDEWRALNRRSSS